ncbi:hypothetical protein Ciccas_007744 [Cichlidogyrus casuarinus]|uniref:C2H2-type domain-containing protein n=1 Tax=Cichlidogyrus casuarinus TaxID=1844966 RepID=A0ABD2Q2N5_9PLAT
MLFSRTGLRPFKCQICARSFSQKSSMKRHVEAVHDGASLSGSRATPQAEECASSVSPVSEPASSCPLDTTPVSLPSADTQISKLADVIEALTRQGVLDRQRAEQLFLLSLVRLLQQQTTGEQNPLDSNALLLGRLLNQTQQPN